MTIGENIRLMHAQRALAEAAQALDAAGDRQSADNARCSATFLRVSFPPQLSADLLDVIARHGVAVIQGSAS